MAEDFDSGFELLPEDEPELSLDEELEALFTPRPLENVDVDPEEPPEPLGRSWDFNFLTSEFNRPRQGHSPQPVHGYRALRVWIEKCLRTARGAHDIYSDEYGIEWPDNLIGQPFSPELVGLVQRSIEEALLVHDRIQAVKEFHYTGSPASELLEISFTVVTDEDDELQIEELPFASLAEAA